MKAMHSIHRRAHHRWLVPGQGTTASTIDALQGREVAKIALATCGLFCRDEIFTGDDVHGDTRPQNIHSTGISFVKLNPGDRSQKIDTCRRGSEEKELIGAHVPGLIDEGRRGTEGLEGSHDPLEVLVVISDEEIEVFGEARFRVEADGPSSDNKVLSARSGECHK
jgi:hypothetical protein